MRLPTSSCLLSRHSVLLKPLNTPRAAVIPSQPASSLSAIHHGLRQSQKSRPQGFSQSSLETAKPRRPSQSSRRSRDPDWTPPTFKIRRGKKDVTDTGPGRQSRRSRFNDPESGFGKRSLVYQMKHGELREKMSELETLERSHKTPSTRRAPTDRLTSVDFMKDFKASSGRPTKSTTSSRRERIPAHVRRFAEQESRERPAMRTRNFDRESTRSADISFSGARRSVEREPRERPAMRTRNFDRESTRSADISFSGARHSIERESRERPAMRTRNFDRESTRSADISFSGARRSVERESRERPAMRTRNFDRESTRSADISSSGTRREAFAKAASSFGSRLESSGTRPKESTGTRNNEGEDTRREHESRRDDGPVRIHHTTAASHFLYGRSVVAAALKDSRRQLYKLYIYNGDDRRNVSQDEMLANLARQKGVEVTKLPNDGLRLMDKMSSGRPHNGCVLEASPLPQLPLKALGPLSEDPSKPGFHLELSHQSSEEAKVNGTSDFISYQLPKGRNPFVLLLDGILDPGNLGAILRTAAFLGVNGIAITRGSSATLTAVALKASAGASEVATLFSVNSTVDFLSRSKENGWLVYAAVPSTKRSRGNSHLTVGRVETYDPLSSQPTVLVIGSEGEGLTKPVRRQADHEVSIPSPSGGFLNVVDSLNVSVATGILCSAFLKKQTSGMIEIEEDSVAVGSEESESQLW